MADFDNSVLQQDQGRMAHLEMNTQNLHNQMQQMANEVHLMREQLQRPPSFSSSPPPLDAILTYPPLPPSRASPLNFLPLNCAYANSWVQITTFTTTLHPRSSMRVVYFWARRASGMSP